MTRDTDPTPPHGIPRPSLSDLDRARYFVTDRLSECYEWEQRFSGEGSEPHPDRPELETLRDLLDIAEVFPALWHSGEGDALEGIADDLARLAGARPCSDCGELIAAAHLLPTAPVCYWCADEDGDTEPSPTPSPWERVADAPAHPFGGAADR